MKVTVLICRLLLGVAVLFFGLNNILHFLSMPMPTGDAGVMMGVLAKSHWMALVGCIMVVAGLLLLVGRFVPLALVFLGPVLVNILTFHLLLEPAGIAPGAILSVLWLVVFATYFRSFVPLFAADPQPKPPTL